NSPVPLYFQVAQRLEQMIESGELATGTRLENEIDLADRLGLSRPTMRRAIESLVGKGLLVRKRGVGTQVLHPKVQRQVELTSLYEDLAQTTAIRARGCSVSAASRLPTPWRSSSGSPRAPRSTCSSGCGTPTASRSPSCATTSRRTCCACPRRTWRRGGSTTCSAPAASTC